MTITKQEARKFLEDFEQGDILAIKNLKYVQSLTTHNSVILNWYLSALENLNAIMIDMEMERVPYDVEFNDLYRKAMELICNKCEQILKEEC